MIQSNRTKGNKLLSKRALTVMKNDLGIEWYSMGTSREYRAGLYRNMKDLLAQNQKDVQLIKDWMQWYLDNLKRPRIEDHGPTSKGF